MKLSLSWQWKQIFQNSNFCLKTQILSVATDAVRFVSVFWLCRFFSLWCFFEVTGSLHFRESWAPMVCELSYPARVAARGEGSEGDPSQTLETPLPISAECLCVHFHFVSRCFKNYAQGSRFNKISVSFIASFRTCLCKNGIFFFNCEDVFMRNVTTGSFVSLLDLLGGPSTPPTMLFCTLWMQLLGSSCYYENSFALTDPVLGLGGPHSAKPWAARGSPQQTLRATPGHTPGWKGGSADAGPRWLPRPGRRKVAPRPRRRPLRAVAGTGTGGGAGGKAPSLGSYTLNMRCRHYITT